MRMDELQPLPQKAQRPQAERGHEERDVAFRPIVWSGVGLLLATVLVYLMVFWVFGYLEERTAERRPAANPLARTYGRQLPPEPRLQAEPILDLRRLRAAEDEQLNTYGWLDRNAGTVRIPIARAMELLAQRGLPTQPQTQPPAAGGGR
jgi:hypothetical protein